MGSLFPDVMVDIETGGLDIDHAPILQISAVRFNIKELTLDSNVFDMCLMVPSGRYWDEGTRDWWQGQPHVLEMIQSRARDPRTVLQKFAAWVREYDSPNFWSKPTIFDYPFIESYYKQFELTSPFHFRNVIDMRSFMVGRHYPEEAPRWDKEIPFEGDAHNALDDVFHQIKALFVCVEQTRG